jgi:hypothetical protein
VPDRRGSLRQERNDRAVSVSAPYFLGTIRRVPSGLSKRFRCQKGTVAAQGAASSRKQALNGETPQFLISDPLALTPLWRFQPKP